MPTEFVQSGYIEVWRDGELVSRHRVEREAVESALADSESKGSGEYELRFPPVRIIVKRAITQPEAPALGDVYSVSTTSLAIPLDRPASGPTQIAEYVLDRRLYGAASFVEVARGLAIFGANNVYTDTGLAEDSQYEYRCKAVDTTGRESEWCAPSFGTTASTAEIYAPTGIFAESVSGGIRVSWTAPSSGLTPTSYEIQRTYAADGTWSVKATQPGTTYDDTDVASGVAKWYRVASINGSNRSDYSATVTAVGGAGTGTLIRFAPGHYIRPGLGDSLASVLSKLSTYDTRVKGITLFRYWKDIETSRGVYDWSWYDSVVATCQTYNKRILMRIQDRIFNQTDPTLVVPQYIIDANLHYVTTVSPRAGTALWRAAAMDYSIEIYKLMIDRYRNVVSADGNPVLAGIYGEESIFGGVDSVYADYSAEGLVTQELRRAHELRAYAPELPYFWLTNWITPHSTHSSTVWTGSLESHAAMTRWFDEACRADFGIFCSYGPDTRFINGVQIDGWDHIRGQVGGIDHRGDYAVIGWTEALEWNAGSTAAQIYAGAVTDAGAAIMVWSTNPAQWASDAYPYIASNATNSTVPTNLTGLVDVI